MNFLRRNAWIIVLMSSYSAFGQMDSTVATSQLKANRFFFGIQGGLAVSSPLKIHNLEGPQKVKNTPAPGYEYGINFGWVWNQRNYLSAGLKVFELNNALSINSNFDIGDDEGLFNPFLNTIGTMNYLSVPFTYEYSFHRRQNSSLNVLGGVTIDMFYGGSSGNGIAVIDSANVKKVIFGSYLIGETTTRVSAHLGLAQYISVFRYQDCRIGLDYNHSFKELMRGEYVVDQNDPDYSYGTLSMSGSYLALNAGYMITGTRKHKKVRASSYDPLKFPKFDIGLNVNSNFYPEPEVTKAIGNLDLVTKVAVSFEGGLSLQCHLSNRYSIHTGLKFGAIPSTYGYDYPANFISGFPEPMSAEYKMGGMNYWKVPFTFEATCFKGKTLQKLTATGGFVLQHYNATGGGDGESAVSENKQDTVRLYSIEVDQGDYRFITLNYTLGLAYYISLFRPSDLRLHMNYNLSAATAVYGYYDMLENTKLHTHGLYTMSGNHLSFGLSYYFRRKIKLIN